MKYYDFTVFKSHLEQYKKEHGDLYVPSSYVSEDGYKLGMRIAVTRFNPSKLEENQRVELNDMGFIWRVPKDKRKGSKSFDFDEYATHLEEYFNEYGDSFVPISYVSKDGYKLGAKTSYVRRWHSKFDEKIESQLSKFDFMLTVPKDKVKRRAFDFALLKKEYIEYKRTHNGSSYVPADYVSPDGYKLGIGLGFIRRGVYKYTPEQKRQLDEIGFLWSYKGLNNGFDKFYSELVQYKQEHGDLLVKSDFRTENGYRLGEKITNVRSGMVHLTEDQKKTLDEIGFVWSVRDSSFDRLYREIDAYRREYGDTLIPKSYVTEDGYRLGKKVNALRSAVDRVSEERKKALEEIGFVWKTYSRRFEFNDFFGRLMDYKSEHNSVKVPYSHIMEDGYPLGRELTYVRHGRIMTDENQKEMLENAGVVYSRCGEKAFKNGFRRKKPQTSPTDGEEPGGE